MVYKGYELLKSIADGEIKEGTELFVTTSLDGRYKNTLRAYIGHNDIYWKYTNKQLPAYAFITGEFELIEDEIDIDSIEELKSVTNNIDGTICIMEKINELIQAVKQLNKEVKELKELRVMDIEESEKMIDEAINKKVEELGWK